MPQLNSIVSLNISILEKDSIIIEGLPLLKRLVASSLIGSLVLLHLPSLEVLQLLRQIILLKTAIFGNSIITATNNPGIAVTGLEAFEYELHFD